MESGASDPQVELRPVATRRRVWRSLWATLAGWLAAVLVTLIFVAPELVRNAAAGSLVYNLAEGLSLWAAFTLLVSSGVWCVVVLPLALVVSAETMVRHRSRVTWISSVGAVLFIGWRLGTWKDLAEGGPGEPLSALFFEYASFGFVLGGVTALVYTRLLRGIIRD